MFNEARASSFKLRSGAIVSLGKLLGDPVKSSVASEPETPETPEKNLEWDSFQIQLQPVPIVACEPKQSEEPTEETLLDLFDQAAL